jgi:hypothetical protein
LSSYEVKDIYKALWYSIENLKSKEKEMQTFLNEAKNLYVKDDCRRQIIELQKHIELLEICFPITNEIQKELEENDRTTRA